MKRRGIENNSQHLHFRFFENHFVKNHLFQFFLLIFLHIFSQKIWYFQKKFDIIFTNVYSFSQYCEIYYLGDFCMKKIALITDGWGRYVTYTWIQGYRNYMAAHQADMDLYIFQSFGNFSMDEKHNAGEYNIARLPDFSEFDGILLDLATVSQPDLIAEIIERAKLSSIPAISLLEQIPGLYHSGIDNYEAISRIVEHLITEHGCRTLNFIGGPEFNRENQLRFKAYRDALLRHGIPFEEQRVIHHNYEIETGIQAF